MNAFDRLTPRTRGYLLLLLLVATLLVWRQAVYLPLQGRTVSLQASRDVLAARVRQMEEERSILEGRREEPPPDPARQRLRGLEQALGEVARELEREGRALASPGRLNRMLRDLAEEREGVRLVALDARRVEPVTLTMLEGRVDANPSGPPLFLRHHLTLTLDTDYLGLLAMLERIERLPWIIFWDGVRFDGREYGQGRARLELHAIALAGGPSDG